MARYARSEIEAALDRMDELRVAASRGLEERTLVERRRVWRERAEASRLELLHDENRADSPGEIIANLARVIEHQERLLEVDAGIPATKRAIEPHRDQNSLGLRGPGAPQVISPISPSAGPDTPAAS